MALRVGSAEGPHGRKASSAVGGLKLAAATASQTCRPGRGYRFPRCWTPRRGWGDTAGRAMGHPSVSWAGPPCLLGLSALQLCCLTSRESSRVSSPPNKSPHWAGKMKQQASKVAPCREPTGGSKQSKSGCDPKVRQSPPRTPDGHTQAKTPLVHAAPLTSSQA